LPGIVGTRTGCSFDGLAALPVVSAGLIRWPLLLDPFIAHSINTIAKLTTAIGTMIA